MWTLSLNGYMLLPESVIPGLIFFIYPENFIPLRLSLSVRAIFLDAIASKIRRNSNVRLSFSRFRKMTL